MACLLNQLSVDYVWGYSPQWLLDKANSRRKFDFYIPKYKLVIEMDGSLGHGKKVFNTTSPNVTEALTIDIWKDSQAKNNGIAVVRIDADESTPAYLKSKIITSLSAILDLSKVDWKKCDSTALTSRVKEVAKIFSDNNEVSATDIAKITGISRNTVATYLKRATKHGWCNYSVENEIRKRQNKVAKSLAVRCSKSVEVYNDGAYISTYLSIAELARKSVDDFGVKIHTQYVGQFFKGQRKHYKGLTFKYVTHNTNKSNKV